MIAAEPNAHAAPELADRSLLVAVIESAPAAMIMVDPSGTIVLVNRETERLFGHDRADLIGAPVETLLPLRFRAAHVQARGVYQRQPEARRMGGTRELHALRRDGSEFPVEIGLNPVRIGAETLVLGAVVDISERVRLEQTSRANEALEARVTLRTRELELQGQRLQQTVQALERSNLELHRFAMVASHDLQAPLRSIANFSQLLARRYGAQLDGQGQKWLATVTRSAQRMSELIRDLLEVSRSEMVSGRFELLSLNDAVDAACVLLEQPIRDAAATLQVEVLPQVLGDRTQLVQLFQNLIGNAIKYRGAQAPLIRIQAQAVAEFWEITVADNGIGIASEHHAQIFDLFHRAHDHSYAGSGIGLAICQRVVARHGGEIWVCSQPGSGATFHMRFPRVDLATPGAVNERSSQ